LGQPEAVISTAVLGLEPEKLEENKLDEVAKCEEN
jgi:hypothetical protein